MMPNRDHQACRYGPNVETAAIVIEPLTEIKSRPYLGLDLIRFMAATLVCLYHLTYWWWRPDVSVSSSHYRDSLQSSFLAAGWVGVPIFFVLSGFVIAFSASRKTASQFMLGRVLRLYPAAWICATITVLVVGWSSDTPLRFLNSIVLNPVGPWVSGVYWTLGAEIVFYIIVACLLALFGSARLVALAGVLAAWSAVYFLLKIADFAGLVEIGAIFGTHQYLTLLETGCFFGLGIVLWASCVHGWSWRLAIIAAISTASGLVSCVAAGRFFSATDPMAAPMMLPAAIWLFAVMLIMASIRWNDELTFIFRKQAKAIRTIGLVTYPLYLVHSEVGRKFMLQLEWLPAVVALVVSASVVLAISLVVVKLERYPRALVISLLKKNSPSK